MKSLRQLFHDWVDCPISYHISTCLHAYIHTGRHILHKLNVQIVLDTHLSQCIKARNLGAQDSIIYIESK